MKAIVCTRYGSPDFLQVQEVMKPICKENYVLVKINSTTVTRADTMMRRADPFFSRLFLGLFKPKNDIMGTGFSGEIIEIGKSVSKFKRGALVFGETGVTFGANAEYISIPEDGVIALKPVNISHDEAAPICDGALTSYNFLRVLAKVKRGKKAMIIGASGGLGTAAVQLAKYYGAEVTGICSHKNVELVKTLGADQVIDYTKEDFTKMEETYDIIYDSVGKSSFNKCKNSLKEDGVYLSPVLSISLLLQMMITSIIGKKKAIFSATGLLPAPELRKYLKEIKFIIEAGALKTVIDKSYPLEQAVEAHRYVDTGRKKGNVVLKV